jgi:DNA-binding CsgD family transcriptional regulator
VAVPAGNTLIGRERHLEVALRQLERARRGSPVSVLVRGGAGLGKTRLAGEIAARADAAGLRALPGRADDLDRGIPYAVFRDVLARVSATGDPLPDSARSLAHSLDVDAPVGGAATDAHLSLVYTRAVRMFRDLAAPSPLLLAIEDLHLADGDSVALIALLARLADIPMMTLVTLRPDTSGNAAELERLIERLAGDGRGAIIEIGPLSRDEIGLLVRADVDAAPGEPVVEAVYTGSAGNPFLAHELVRSLTARGLLAVEAGRVQLATGAASAAADPDIVARMFGAVGDEALALARVVAAFGRFSLDHLSLAARLISLPEDQAGAAFDRLVAARILVRGDDGGYAFTHGIMRDALYEGLGPAERRRLHGAIAGQLALERRAGVLLDVAQLANHVAQSADPGDEAAIEVLLEAARAVEATAPLVAAGYYRRAVELLPVDSPRRAPTMALHARSLYVASRPLDAASVGREALRDLLPGPVRRSTVSIVVNGLNIAGLAADSLDVVDSELEQLSDDVTLLAQRVHLLLSVGRPGDAAAARPPAVAALERASRPELVAVTHLLIYAMDLGDGELSTAMLDRLEGWLPLASPDRARAIHETIAFAYWLPGFVPVQARHIEAAQKLRDAGTGLSIAGNLEVALVNHLQIAGRWDDALELCHSASFDFEVRGAWTAVCLLRSVACELLVHRGELDAAAALAEGLSPPIEELRSAVILCRARVRRALGDDAAALALLSGQAERAQVTQGQLRRAELLAELAELLVVAGRHEDAAAVADAVAALAATSGRYEPALIAPYVRAIVERDAAAAREYLAVAEREQLAFERARARLVLGELDVEPGENLVRAYKEFDGLLAGPWRRRAAGAMRARGLRVPRPAAHRASGTLTEAEERLVRLVADGLTNRQIAAAMHYSEKTVEVYLSRVYAKTGCGSRVKLVQAVASGTLVLSA